MIRQVQEEADACKRASIELECQMATVNNQLGATQNKEDELKQKQEECENKIDELLKELEAAR